MHKGHYRALSAVFPILLRETEGGTQVLLQRRHGASALPEAMIPVRRADLLRCFGAEPYTEYLDETEFSEA